MVRWWSLSRSNSIRYRVPIFHHYNLLSWRRAITSAPFPTSWTNGWRLRQAIGNLLHREGAYIKNPGLGTAPITDDEGYDERSLSSEQQEELKGVFSYTNHLQIQHQWGPLIHRHYDYTARIRSEARAMGGPLSNIILCSLGGLVAGR